MKHRILSRYLFVTLASVILLLVVARSGRTHPHVYVDAALTFVVDGQGLAAMRENWLFDDIFSRAILGEVGLDPASLATPEGQAKIKQGAFDYLANSGYFTHLSNQGKPLPVKTVRDFRASLREGRLVYDFTVPLNLPFSEINNFRAVICDREYYTDVLLVKDAIRFENAGGARVEFAVRPAKDLTYWQFIVPEGVHLALVAPSAPAGTGSSLVVAGAGDELNVFERLMNSVRMAQKWLTIKLNGFGLDIKAAPFGSALWLFLGFAFVYGVVHAVGPGHGKAVVCSYFLSHPGSFASGAVMGSAITFIHTGSAALAVAAAYLIFSVGMGGVTEASLALQPASYALLALMGLFLLGKALRDLARGGLIAEPSCPASSDTSRQSGSLREILLVSFVTGLVPCPGAAVILAFSIGQGILWAGLGAIVAMAVGMGVTTTLFAWGAVAARSATLKLSSGNRRLFNWAYAALSIGGATVIAVFGAVLFMGSSVWH